MYKVWKCNYCSHIEDAERDAATHEKECSYNPKNKGKPRDNEDVKLTSRDLSIDKVGKFVERARDLGLNPKNLAEKLGISVQQFHELKSGLLGLGLDLELMGLFGKALGIEIQVLIGTLPSVTQKITLGDDVSFKIKIAEEGGPSSIEIQEKNLGSGLVGP